MIRPLPRSPLFPYTTLFRSYAPTNATVVVVGDVNPERVLSLARRYYGPVARKTIPERKPLPEPVQRGIKHVVLKAPAELAYVRFGYKAPALRDPARDWEPFAVLAL